LHPWRRASFLPAGLPLSPVRGVSGLLFPGTRRILLRVFGLPPTPGIFPISGVLPAGGILPIFGVLPTPGILPIFGTVGSSPALLPEFLFQHPEGFIKPPEEFLEILRKDNHRLPFKASGFSVLAFYHIEVQIPRAVLFDIDKIGSIRQVHPGRKQLSP
jgi:hypothetical protein